jgi:adenylate cyclase
MAHILDGWDPETLVMSELHASNEIVDFILTVSRRMAQIRELPQLLTYVVEQVLLLVEAERVYLGLRGEDGRLDLRVQRDRAGNDLDQADELSTTILDQVLSSGESLVLRNAMSDPRFYTAESVHILQLRSLMCVPLRTRSQIVGVIYVENRALGNRFSAEKDLPPLELFANQAATAAEGFQRQLTGRE